MKFYNMNQLISQNADINFSIGGRCSGKSYQMGKFLLNHWLETGKQFVRAIRSWMYCKGLESYFNEIVYNEELPVQVRFHGNRYFIQRLDENGKPVGDEEIFGFCEVISTEQSKKSVQFPNVDIMFLEEFVAADLFDYATGSFDGEWEHLKSLMSTVFRKRPGRMFFIGNNLDVSNPYFEKFGIRGEKLKMGQIVNFETTFEHNGREVKGQKIAVEVVPIGWENVDEIPALLRFPDNDIAISGEVSKAKDVLENVIQFYHDGESVKWFRISEEINLWKPLLAVWSWYRGNIFQDMRDCSYCDDKYRRYLTITDYNGNVIIAEIPEIEDCREVADISETDNLDLFFPVPQANGANRTNGDLETLWGTEIKAMFFNDMMTRYDYQTDRIEVMQQQRLPRNLGFGTCPRTEAVKDYIGGMQASESAGYRKRELTDCIAARMEQKLDDIAEFLPGNLLTTD